MHPSPESQEMESLAQQLKIAFDSLLWPSPPDINGPITSLRAATGRLVESPPLIGGDEDIWLAFNVVRRGWQQQTNTLLAQMMTQVAALRVDNANLTERVVNLKVGLGIMDPGC